MFNSIRKNLTKIIATATIAASAFTPAFNAFPRWYIQLIWVYGELSGAVQLTEHSPNCHMAAEK